MKQWSIGILLVFVVLIVNMADSIRDEKNKEYKDHGSSSEDGMF